jgi:hypothetical protein
MPRLCKLFVGISVNYLRVLIEAFRMKAFDYNLVDPRLQSCIVQNTIAVRTEDVVAHLLHLFR